MNGSKLRLIVNNLSSTQNVSLNLDALYRFAYVVATYYGY